MMDRRACLQATLASLLVAPASAAESAPATDLAADLEPLRQKFGLPAFAAAVGRSGAIVAGGAVGVRALGRPEKVAIDDRFHLGSDTKAFTATLGGMMVDAGKLDWAATIGDVLGKDTPGINPALAAVTLQQLLAHSSGIPSDTDELIKLYFSADSLTYNIADMRRRTFDAWKGRAPATKPGAEFHYSNLGYMIAGLMIEQTAGLSWEELIVERIYGPLGLKSAGFGPQATTGRLDAPVGHQVEGDRITPIYWGPGADIPALLGPAGTAHMSILDFAAWANWNAGGGKRGPGLVKPETLAYIQSPKISTGRIANPRPGTPDEGEYCFGWGQINFDWTQAPVLTHNGSNGMNFAKILVDPARDIAIVIATNFPGEKADDASNTIVETLYRKFV